MPLRIPATTAEDIWSYITRKLTNLSDARAGYIDLLINGTYGLEAIKDLVMLIPTTPMRGTDNALLAASYVTERGTDNAELESDALARYNVFKTVEFEKCQAPATQNAAVAVAVTTADQSLGSKDITVDIPANATIISVIAVARINIMNNAATAQKIDLKFEVEGVVLFSQTNIVGFGAVDGTSASYIIAEDASDEVTLDGQVVTLEAKTTLSSATSVRFQAQYYLFITYKMG